MWPRRLWSLPVLVVHVSVLVLGSRLRWRTSASRLLLSRTHLSLPTVGGGGVA